MDSSNLRERAVKISETTNLLSDELVRLDLPEPSFEHGLPAPIHSDAPDSSVRTAKQKLLQMLDELRALLTEPALHLTSEMRNPMLSIHPIIRLGIAENFPPQGSTVQDLAHKLDLRESLVRRLLAHCSTYHVYYQASPDHFVHTAASKLLAENDGMRNWFLIGAQETLPGTLKTADALIKYPNSEEPEHCGWSVQNATDLPIFRAMANMPERAKVVAGAMTWHAMLPGYSAQYLAANFPWRSSGQLLVVDVGGGLGHVSRTLIEYSPTVQCIVEDLSEVILQAQEGLSADLRERINFKVHDFFQEQPVKGADVYLLRLILHDWSDKYATLIIRALIPALKGGAKVVVNDRVVPGCGEAHYLAEREARDSDMYMLAFQNGKERTADDWTRLFRGADRRFKLSQVYQPVKSYLAIVEFTWES